MPNRHAAAVINENVKAPKALFAGASVATQISGAAGDLFSELAPECRVDPMILWGAWPGKEPVELLMEDLAVVCLRLQKDRRAKPSET
jgi:hypothetical protein